MAQYGVPLTRYCASQERSVPFQWGPRSTWARVTCPRSSLLGHLSDKIIRQMAGRGWTKAEIEETVQTAQRRTK